MAEPQSVQGYIDQTPSWPDGPPPPASDDPDMQWRIWTLATAGKFFEGLVVFMTGVALPLIVEEFGLSPAGKGLVSAATLAGIMIGAITLGGLSDTYGRRRMFVIEMLVFVVFLAGLTVAPSFGWLVFFLFGVGPGAGKRLSDGTPRDLREYSQPRIAASWCWAPSPSRRSAPSWARRWATRS